MSSQKLIYTLRCCPCSDHELLHKYDALLRDGLGSILNIDMTESQWIQASLPIKLGGLGIRRVASLALPAFLASAAGTRALQSAMLDANHTVIDESVEGAAVTIVGAEEPQPDQKGAQHLALGEIPPPREAIRIFPRFPERWRLVDKHVAGPGLENVAAEPCIGVDPVRMRRAQKRGEPIVADGELVRDIVIDWQGIP